MIIDRIRLVSDLVDISGTNMYVDFALNPYAGDNGYIVKDLSGFGPSDTLPYVEGFDSNGESIADNIPINKLLTITCGINPGAAGSVSSLRDALVRYLSRRLTVQLCYGDTVKATIAGFIRKFEVPHSTREPLAQITIECNDGLFSSPNLITKSLVGFSTTTPTIDYLEGTAPTGVEMGFTLVLGGSISSVGFTGISGGQQWHFSLGGTYTNGDYLLINTDKSVRSAFLLRASLWYDVASYLTSGSIWPKLHPGRNAFTAIAGSTFTWERFRYIPKFWGV